jgi:hypothetical protein
MELTDLNIRGMKGDEFYKMEKVRITPNLPKLHKSLPNSINTDVHTRFKAIICPLVTREQCDMLIGVDNAHLIEMIGEPNSCIVDGDLIATRTCVGWGIRGCEPEATRPPAATAIDDDINPTADISGPMPGVCGILERSKPKPWKKSFSRRRARKLSTDDPNASKTDLRNPGGSRGIDTNMIAQGECAPTSSDSEHEPKDNGTFNKGLEAILTADLDNKSYSYTCNEALR